MKSFFLWLLAGVVAVGVRASEAPDASRYQIIVDRSPFGPVNAAGADAAKPPFAERYQFVALVMSNGGQGPVQAIIHDKEANRSFFRAEGEKLDEAVTVVSVSTEPAKIVLQSGLEKATLSFLPRAPGPAMAAANAAQPKIQPGIPMPGQPVPPGQPRRIPFRRTTN